ncbi:MAG TPA: alanine--tRNA ligase [Patescibacteria group bacterium]|jgi:alanyl-tRNA synthetase|nr:alanine--tRNA ligase [Patescibacteria group bacterium]
MTAQEIRQAYQDFFAGRGHQVITRAQLVPQNDSTTLFTGSGMQPLLPNLLGEPHPGGSRLVDSQPCLRVQDIDEVGDNRHTTFFEMLGNWSLGDYFKQDQINWFWEFLTKTIGLDPQRIYVSCFIGDEAAGVPKDTQSAEIWKQLFGSAGIEATEIDIGSEEDGYNKGEQGGRIFFYGDKNWWSRAGNAQTMPEGEPGGPDTEMFYLFPEVVHDQRYGEHCHVNCDCGRYIELGNSVFMEYLKTATGFEKLPKQNVDYGGGLERIAAAALDSPDIYKVSLLWPIIVKLEELSGRTYDNQTSSLRIIADHLRAATFLAVDGVTPSNKEQGYVMRRLVRRAMRHAFELGIEQNLCQQLIPIIADLYKSDYPEVAENRDHVIEVLIKEEKIFRQTLRAGVREFNKLAGRQLSGAVIFKLYDTYGFPIELSLEEALGQNLPIDPDWQAGFNQLMDEQRQRSKTAGKGEFKGGLADHSDITTKYHTTTHLMYRALRQVLGDEVIQKGANITPERIRFDFSHSSKMTSEEISQVEQLVNQQIAKDWPVSWREENTNSALSSGVMGAFGDRYGQTVKVYTIGDPDGDYYSREICGGPHVEHTGQLAENGWQFKIIKEESSSAGVRRIKAVLQ